MQLIRIYIEELYRDSLSTYDIEHDEHVNVLLEYGMMMGELYSDLNHDTSNLNGNAKLTRFQTIDPSKVIFDIHKINLKEMYIEGMILLSKESKVLPYIQNMVAVPRSFNLIDDGSIDRLITFDLKYVDPKDINETTMEIPIPLEYKGLVSSYDFDSDEAIHHCLTYGELSAGLFPVMASNSVGIDGKLIYEYYDKAPLPSLSVATVTKINPMYMTITIKPKGVWNNIFKQNIDRLVAIPRFSIRMNSPEEFYTKGLCTQHCVTFDIDIQNIYPAVGIDIKSKPKILEGGDA